MASTESQARNLLENYNGLYIFATAPHQSCCHCQRQLKPRYAGICIWFRIYPCPLLFAVCATCQSAALRGMKGWGRKLSVISPEGIESIFNEDRIVGFAQIRRCGDSVLLEPYPNRGK
jgi:hypothetical protein